jgi:outer membrane protein
MLLLTLTLLTATPDTLSLSLSQALDVAFRRSPARVQASVSRTEGGLQLAQGIAALLPGASGDVSYGDTRSRSSLLPDSITTTRGWSGALTISQVVFDPQVYANLVSSAVSLGYYSADAADKQAQLVYNVTNDYLGLLTARLLRDAAKSALDRTEDNLNLNQQKLRLGSASQIDVMRSEVYKSQAQMEIISADKALATANATFLATAGITQDVVVRPTESLAAPSTFEITNPDSLVIEIERRNPGLKMATKSRTIADIGLVSSVAQVLPSVSAFWTSDYSDSVFPSSVRRWDDHDDISYGIRFSLPLLDVKSYVLDIASAATSARRTRAATAAARLQLRSSALAAVIGYEQARQTYDYAQRNLQLNQELYRLAQEQRRLGAISLIDFFQVETNLSQAQASYVQALSDTYIQAAQISYLLGRTAPAGH